MSPDEDARHGVTYLNELRRSLGLDEVVLDPSMSLGATLHAQYLTTNSGRPELVGLLAHHEAANLPGATLDGANAGEHAVIDWGNSTAAGAIDVWISTLYHRTALLRRDLRRIGIGHSGDIHVLSLDLQPFAHQAPVLYPYDRQRDVPALYARGEFPDPRPRSWFGTGYSGAADLRSGFPITITFDRDARIADVRGALADRNGPLDVAVSSPQAPATTFSQGNVVALLPRRVLTPGMTYRANVAYTVDGAPGQLVWEFSTAPPRAFDPGLPPPAPGTAIGVAGIVESAWSMKLCDDEAHTRCKEHIELALVRTSPTKAVQIEVYNPGPDRPKLLGLVGQSIEVSGVVDSSSTGLVTLALDDARSLVIADDKLPVINADAITPHDVDSFVWITGTLAKDTIGIGDFVFVKLGAKAPVYISLSADLWRASVKQLVGRQVRVRGRVRRGQPDAGASYVNVTDAGQIASRASPGEAAR